MKQDSLDKKVKYLPMTTEEKSILKKRIYGSINNQKIRKSRVRLFVAVAASVILFAGFGYYFYNSQNQKSSIIDYVKSLEGTDKENTDKITLILGKGEKLKINSKSAEISYSKTGQDITLDSTKTISQEIVGSKEPVYNTLIVPYGKRLKTYLSDGSTVWLNSGSKMVYPVVFNDDKREVYVKGEAIFEVVHNKKMPFFVISDDQIIEVLGTVFSVTNYEEETTISTVLKSGSVQLSYLKGSSQVQKGDKIIISPGTKASFDKKTKDVLSKKVDVDIYFSWREGLLVFRNDNLEFIMRRISRYYNVDVTIDEQVLRNETFSGYLDLNEDLEKVLNSVKESTDIEYERIPNGIIINQKNKSMN